MKREATAYSLSTEAEQEDPVDSWVQKPFCVPHFLFVGNRLHSASMTFPEFKGQFKQSIERSGDAETRGKLSSALGWGRLPLRGYAQQYL